MEEKKLESIKTQLRIAFEIPFKYAKIVNKEGIVIEVRTKEQGHNIEHCHVTYKDKEVSVSLVDYKILSETNMNEKEITAVLKCVKENIEILREAWEKYHNKIEL
jgi:hypothetical protein|nr:MAG TPA: protein of unknown function (DUF4160) [Caudoviricetes sp.]